MCLLLGQSGQDKSKLFDLVSRGKADTIPSCHYLSPMTSCYTTGLDTRILATNPAAPPRAQFASLEAATSWITVEKPTTPNMSPMTLQSPQPYSTQRASQPRFHPQLGCCLIPSNPASPSGSLRYLQVASSCSPRGGLTSRCSRNVVIHRPDPARDSILVQAALAPLDSI